jgi:chromosome segregation protein
MVFSHQMPEIAFAADVLGSPIVPTVGYLQNNVFPHKAKQLDRLSSCSVPLGMVGGVCVLVLSFSGGLALYLSRMNAFGFKSFAQKVEVKFQKGITCVVGPNGCGKSNVVDAIRWCLGEQRARALRSSSMEDVIFQGSRSRKPLGLAEVSITIDNSSKVLPVEFTEVTLTRRLYRSGESEYLINKIPCLLRDIHNLTMDTGLGAHSYSVIEQGMVDEIISDKTDERRRIFEEAAGVTRYKLRRKSAWNKLQSIQQDLTRIADIIGEVERQVRSLARQERKARLYKQLSDELTEIEVKLGRFQYFEMSDKSRPMLEEMSFLKEDIDVATTDVARQEARLEEIRAELAEQDQALADSNAEVGRQVDLVHKKDREIAIAREEIRSLTSFLERAGRQLEELKIRRESALRDKSRAEQGATEARQGLEESTSALEVDEETLKEVTGLLNSWRGRVEHEKTRSNDLFREMNEKSSRLERVRTEQEGAEERCARLAADSERLVTESQLSKEKLAGTKGQVTAVEEEIGRQTSLRNELAEEKSRIQQQGDALVEERVGARSQLEGEKARLALLRKLQESFDGYSNGVQALAGEDSPLRDRIRGLVADTIEVDTQYASAVEAALGRALDCVILDSTSDALEAISFLREGKHGTGSFFALERILQGTGTPWEVPQGDGIVGRASDLVERSRDESGAARALLRCTLVVRDAETAIHHYSHLRSIGVDAVTVAGEVFGADGIIYGGGSSEAASSLIGRKQQIEELDVSVAGLEDTLQDLEDRIRSIVDVLGERTARLEREDEVLADLKNRRAGLQRDEQNALDAVDRIEQASHDVVDEQERLSDRLSEVSRQVCNSRIEIRALESRRLIIEEAERALAQTLHRHEGMRSEAHDRASARRVEIASLKERAESLSQDAVRLEREAESLITEQQRLATESEEGDGRKAQLEESVTTASEELESLHALQTEAETKRDGQAETHQELMMMARGVEEELRSRSRKVTQNRERLHQLEVSLAELKTRAEELHRRITRDYELDLKEVGRLEEPEFNSDISAKKVIEVQDRLRRMGSVNLAALEEYDIQKERYEFLAKQRDDLLEAEETLKRTIQKIDRTARTRFMETFQLIRTNFHKTYASFFEGGEADLIMPDDEDPLEAPIEISARPRGKRLQSINLLSGGERALTAISLLFAIYLVKPSPYCILDEVDAPLDDANVGRFVRVIKEFSAKTQFLVVTHNKVTMEAADALHGVTMEEPGVSKLVSVKIAQDDEPTNGNASPIEEDAVPADD